MAPDTFPDFRTPVNVSVQEHSRILLRDLKANLHVALEHRRKLPTVALSRLYWSFESLVEKINGISEQDSASSLQQIHTQCNNILARLNQTSVTNDRLLQADQPQTRRHLPLEHFNPIRLPLSEVKREDDGNTTSLELAAQPPHAVRHPSILVHEQAFIGASRSALSEASASSEASFTAAEVAAAASSNLPSPRRHILACQTSTPAVNAKLVARRNRGVAHAHCIVRKLQKTQASRPNADIQAQVRLAEQELVRREQLLRHAKRVSLGAPSGGYRVSKKRR